MALSRYQWSSLLSLLATAATAAAAVDTLPAGTLQLPLNRILNQSAYGIESSEYWHTGTKMIVEIDTGSPFLGLAGTKSNWCKLASKPCAVYGSYSNSTSSTAKYVSDDFYNLLINHGFGDYINDTVGLGGRRFPNMKFGMILDYEASFPAPDNIPGLIGLAPFCYQNNSCAAPALTLQQELIQKGYIHRHTLGVYLGPDEPTAQGQVLFSAMDHAKQLGEPVTFPVIPLKSALANSSPNVVYFSSVSLERSGSYPVTTKNFNISAKSYGILDTGNPIWSLPTPVWQFAHSYLGLGPSDPGANFYAVNCKFRKAQPDGATLIVGFAHDKLKIRIPMERLVTQLAPGKCGTAISDCGSTGEGCAFGDPFLRSTYTYFDFEALTVTMSNVNYTDKTDIVASK